MSVSERYFPLRPSLKRASIRSLALVFTAGSFLNHENSAAGFYSQREAAMKTPILMILIATAVIVGAVLAVMNNACKSSQHTWCAPMTNLRHHIKTG